MHSRPARTARSRARARRSGATRRCRVADWDRDGRPDLVVNSIWGKVRLVPQRRHAHSAAAGRRPPIEVEWLGDPPKPAWAWWTPGGQGARHPVAHDAVRRRLDRDGLTDLVMLDHEGYLAFFERSRTPATAQHAAAPRPADLPDAKAPA